MDSIKKPDHELLGIPHNNFLVTADMEICNLLDKKFKTAVLKKLSELPENTGRQFNKIRKTLQEKNENITKI